jgi:hypothetical protein
VLGPLNSRAVNAAILFACAVLFSANVNASGQTCPPCYTNGVPPVGHGSAPDGSGRRVINIYIDSTWNTPSGTTNTQIWNAVAEAASNWNSATDNSGNHTGYYFAVNQSGGNDQADIIISYGSTLAGTTFTATTDTTLDPPVVDLNPALNGSTGVSTDSAAATISHEFGHFMGLGNADYKNGNSCGSSNSIMRNAYTDLTSVVLKPSTTDVAQTNQHLNSPANCQESSSVDNANETADEGTDPGSGSGGSGGGNPGPPPACNQGQGICTSCIPPACWGGCRMESGAV